MIQVFSVWIANASLPFLPTRHTSVARTLLLLGIAHVIITIAFVVWYAVDNWPGHATVGMRTRTFTRIPVTSIEQDVFHLIQLISRYDNGYVHNVPQGKRTRWFGKCSIVAPKMYRLLYRRMEWIPNRLVVTCSKVSALLANIAEIFI